MRAQPLDCGDLSPLSGSRLVGAFALVGPFFKDLLALEMREQTWL